MASMIIIYKILEIKIPLQNRKRFMIFPSKKIGKFAKTIVLIMPGAVFFILDISKKYENSR